MTTFTNNNSEIRFEVSEESLDVYVNDKLAGDFTVEGDGGYITITPSSIDLECIDEARKGHYSFIIDAILSGELNEDLSDVFGELNGIEFESVLRTEKACNFWSKRGFKNEYNSHDHENGEQDTIAITIL